jgi:hypothetical protein
MDEHRQTDTGRVSIDMPAKACGGTVDKRCMAAEQQRGNAAWTLPPLILHPFSNAMDPFRFLANSRNVAASAGDSARGDGASGPVQRRLLLTRYCEVRMLWCIGKDVLRWIDQCLDFVNRQSELKGGDIRFQSLATLLIDNTPAAAVEKLLAWGVTDYQNLFARAIGLNSIFAELPALGILSEDFLKDYYSFAYQIYLCRQQAETHRKLDAGAFSLDVFTSGEYIKIIERQAFLK